MKKTIEYKKGESILGFALYYRDRESKGLDRKELKECTGLNEEEFNKGLCALIDKKDIAFKETANGRLYFLSEELKETIDHFRQFP